MKFTGEKCLMVSLREFLFYQEKSITEFAKELEVSRNYLSQIALGHLKPSKRLARDIEQATDGKVKAEELLKGNEEKENGK